MAFVFTPEDGTGLEDANAYVEVDYADDYHAGRANADWDDATDGEKRAAIVKATDYIDGVFGERFIGVPLVEGQALCWPRANAFLGTVELEEVVPDLLKRACAEYALRALEDELDPDGNQDAVVEETKSAGGISHAVKYAGAAGTTRHPAADRLLRSLVLPPACVRA